MTANEDRHDIGDESANQILEEFFRRLDLILTKLDELIEMQKNLEMKVSGCFEKQQEHRRRGNG